MDNPLTHNYQRELLAERDTLLKDMRTQNDALRDTVTSLCIGNQKLQDHNNQLVTENNRQHTYIEHLRKTLVFVEKCLDELEQRPELNAIHDALERSP